MKYIGVILITIIDTILIGWLFAGVVEDSNDKTGMVLLFGYALIVVGNLLLWGILNLLSNRFAKLMGSIVLVLVLLFLPALIFALQY